MILEKRDGIVVGVYTGMPVYEGGAPVGATFEEVAEDHPEVVAFLNPPPPRRTVPKSVVISRLTDDQLAAALGAMTQRQQERWRSPDSPTVYADDQEVVGMIEAIGADPDVVLAPEV